MIELSQWRASIGGFHSREKMKPEIPMTWKKSLSKAQQQLETQSSKTPSSRKTKPTSTTEMKKVTPINDTATHTTHMDAGNTCCVTLLVCLHSKYIL